MTKRRSTARTVVGDVLAARYEIRALLGRGGMGEVYEAADRLLDRTVAVKVLRAELTTDPRFLARFRREARTAARLHHEGIVAIYDIAQSDERVFIVMELVPGTTLAELARRDRPVDPVRAARLVAEAADALAHAHTRGVVHRDVSPGNLMVTPAGRVKVLDFGIARAARGLGSGRSGSDAHGTVPYAAPEQARGGGDHRVDVYALGAVLNGLLAGWGPSPTPPALRDVVDRCLVEDPDARFASAGHLARALRSATDEAVTAPMPTLPVNPSGPLGDDFDAPTTAVLPPAATPTHVRRRSGRIAASVAIAAMALGGLWVAAPVLAGLGGAGAPAGRGPTPIPRPTGVTASASCDGWLSTGVDLAWSPGGVADGYEVFRRGAEEDTFRLVARLDGWRSTSYRDTDLGVDSGYVYRVRAVDGGRAGRFGPEAHADTPLFCLT
jgi:serine/threonine-protein kinase